jgi:hypothetical protein
MPMISVARASRTAAPLTYCQRSRQKSLPASGGGPAAAPAVTAGAGGTDPSSARSSGNARAAWQTAQAGSSMNALLVSPNRSSRLAGGAGTPDAAMVTVALSGASLLELVHITSARTSTHLAHRVGSLSTATPLPRLEPTLVSEL